LSNEDQALESLVRGLEDGDAIAAVRGRVVFVQSFPSGFIVVPMLCLVVHLGCRLLFHSDTFLVISYYFCSIVGLLLKAKKTAARSKKAKQAKASKSKKSKAAAKLVKEHDGGGGGSTKVDKK
jgi:hypothetical protein